MNFRIYYFYRYEAYLLLITKRFKTASYHCFCLCQIKLLGLIFLISCLLTDVYKIFWLILRESFLSCLFHNSDIIFSLLISQYENFLTLMKISVTELCPKNCTCFQFRQKLKHISSRKSQLRYGGPLKMCWLGHSTENKGKSSLNIISVLSF